MKQSNNPTCSKTTTNLFLMPKNVPISQSVPYVIQPLLVEFNDVVPNELPVRLPPLKNILKQGMIPY